jgi:hypothetical protein
MALAEDDEFGSKEWEEGLSALRDMLGFVAGRWGLAGEFVWHCFGFAVLG